MLTGSLVDGRFELIQLAGRGGMGTVYRALDRTTGLPVALKLLHDAGEDALLRFGYEARILGGIEHPHVVRYIMHGETGASEPYLVMEWLEGENLADRLAREGLRVEQSLDIARRIASALGAAHARGVVHRDIKPSNIFLAGGAIEAVKLLDFGIARLDRASVQLTHTGSVLGTPGYMAPEQARGERGEIDARADVFSLGCVLFECLTGKPAFMGSHVLALLAKLLMEDPPRARELRPEIPEALDMLVAQMLSKDPAARPENGAAVVDAIDRLGSLEASVLSQRPEPHEVLTEAENRLVSVVAVAPVKTETAEGVLTDGATLESSSGALLEAARHVVKPFGAKVEEIANGMLVALLVGTGLPTDQAAIAARSALAIRSLLPDASIVLLTGRGEHRGRLPVGEVLESAASMLNAHPRGAGIRLNELARSLLEGRFDIQEERGYLLLGEERGTSGGRTLLGKQSPFVGREREMRNLLELIDESFDEQRSRAILVTADPGMGKSRLRHEVLQRLKDVHPEVVISMGRGDSMASGSAFAVVASSVRNALGLAASAPAEDQRSRLSALVKTFVEEKEQRRVAAFLGELIGAPFQDEGDARLGAARQNPAIMADQIQAAYLDFMRGQLGSRPSLLVFEDLHWSDHASVRLIQSALRDFSDRAFVVLAFARPEIRETFPKLWEGRDVQEISLGRLSKRAAESLIRSVLGGTVEPVVVARIIERAEGHAFFLEELIRVVAEGRGSELPQSVLGMVETRLARLDPEARRYLRAASIFGETFWEKGVRVLLGEDPGSGGRTVLDQLCQLEFVSRRVESRFVDEREYTFRHALVRDAAYAMLTDKDRALGHELAGEWLSAAGEQDAMVLAEHFDRGTSPWKAAPFYLKVAWKMPIADLGKAIPIAEKALGCAADDAVKLSAYARISTACAGIGEFAKGYEAAMKARLINAPRDPHYTMCLGTAAYNAFSMGRLDDLPALSARLLAHDPVPGAAWHIAFSLAVTASMLFVIRQRTTALHHLRRAEHIGAAHEGESRVLAGYLAYARGLRQREFDGDLWGALQSSRESRRIFEQCGDETWVAVADVEECRLLLVLGMDEELHRALDGSLDSARPPTMSRLHAMPLKGMAYLNARRVEEARALAESLESESTVAAAPWMLAQARLLFVQIDLLCDRLEDAETKLVAFGKAHPQFQMGARFLSLSSELRRRQGKWAEAVELAASSVEAGNAGSRYFFGEEPLLLRHAEALFAWGDIEGAKKVIAEAQDDLLKRAAKIPDERVREGFYRGIPEHARILALAGEWLA